GDVFLSLRFWSYATLGFGLLGVVSELFELAGGGVTLAVASAVGLLSGGGASLAFRALTRAETGSGGSAGELVGASGRVLLGGEAPARVKVRVEVRGRQLDLLATSDDGALDAGDRVLVLEVRGDEVHVARAPAEVE
ncbi:MAG: NfeD family protein, partial [Deltaproteobacteria bacterium]|nr:NfeD family protein [Deltaproteobacteria bacterium]